MLIGAGCLLQLLVSKTNYWYLPCLLFIGGSIVSNLLVYVNLMENPYEVGVVPGRASAVLPRNYRDGQASDEFAVLHLGFRINSPFGVLDPTARMMMGHFSRMAAHLEADTESTGLLNKETYIGTTRASQNTILNVFYFRSYEDILRFSAGFHMKGWKEYNALPAERKTAVEIWHEGFVVSKSEAIYAGVTPIGMCNMWQRNDENKEGEEWINGLHGIESQSNSRQRMG